ncbi:hypothetical protein ABPG74_010828 [Tetrahymena malaccensis]
MFKVLSSLTRAAVALPSIRNTINISKMIGFQRQIMLNNLNSFSFSQTAAVTNKKGNIIGSQQIPFDRWRIVRGDKVVVISGKDQGKSGTVIRVYRKTNRVLVEGINVKLKRVAGNAQDESKGSIHKKIHSIHVSKVSLIDPETGKSTRIRFGYLEDGKKVRISTKSGSIIEKPFDHGWKRENRNKNKVDGMLDTPAEKVLQVTYKGEDFDTIKRDFEKFIQDKERKEKLLVFKE